MTLSEMQRSLREMNLSGDIHEMQVALEIILAVMNEPGPVAAGLRSSCARLIVVLAEKVMKETG